MGYESNFPLVQNCLKARERIFDNLDRCALNLSCAARLKIERPNHVHKRDALRFGARTREQHGESGISRNFTALRNRRDKLHAERVERGRRQNERRSKIPLLLFPFA